MEKWYSRNCAITTCYRGWSKQSFNTWLTSIGSIMFLRSVWRSMHWSSIEFRSLPKRFLASRSWIMFIRSVWRSMHWSLIEFRSLPKRFLASRSWIMFIRSVWRSMHWSLIEFRSLPKRFVHPTLGHLQFLWMTFVAFQMFNNVKLIK